MKLSPALLMPLLVGARATAARMPHSKARRDTTDTCAYFGDVFAVSVPNSGGFIDFPVPAGCYCISTIAETIMNNGLDADLAGWYGEIGTDSIPGTIAAITSDVNAAADHEVCTYPDNSEPACTSGNVCGFTCNPGFTPSGGECVCVSPTGVNGACVVPSPSVDTCAYFEGIFQVDVSYPGGSLTEAVPAGCYCISTIAATIMNNGLEQEIFNTYGDLGTEIIPATVTAIANALVNANPGNEVCTYPENSAPACTTGDVCRFTCINGFTVSGSDCVCVSPLVILDGVCVTPGSSVDTCAYFDNVDLVVGSLTYDEGLEGCYCTSTILTTLTSNGFGETIVERGGLASLGAAEAAIAAAITAADDVDVCAYPLNSAPACSQSSVCGFTCTNHFTLSGWDCVCLSPRVLSDGACIIPGSPGLRRRDMFRDNSGCAWYEDACGIPGEPSAWECLDTRSALDSCGGCVYPAPAGLVAGVQAAQKGEDCTEVPHAMEIACRASRCVVDRCEERYTVSADRSRCIPSAALTSNLGLLNP